MLPAPTTIQQPAFGAANVETHTNITLPRRVDVRQPGVGTRGGLVDLRRAFHVQSYVRALVVEDLNEFVEASLLWQEVGGRRLGGFFLQGEMHALVTTIGLRRQLHRQATLRRKRSG